MHKLCSPILLAYLLAHAVPAQCGLQLMPTGQGIPGVNGAVTALTSWDPDGNGPQPARMVVGGRFGIAGNQIAALVATFEPNSQQWQALGNLSTSVSSLVVLPNGALVAGGYFDSGGAECLMEWNGSTWVRFGGGGNPAGTVGQLAVAANGDLVAVARNYVGSGFVDTAYRRVGTVWQRLGDAAGPFYPEIYALLALPNGDVVVGGRFSSMGGVAAAGIARWDGASWSPLGTGTTGFVSALLRRPNGDLVAGGGFAAIGGTPAANVAVWNGSQWSPLASGTAATGVGSATVRSFSNLPNGDLLAAGQFTVAGGLVVNKVARWNGTAWSALGAGIEPDPLSGSASSTAVYALHVLQNGDVVAAGNFETASGRDAINIARFDGTTWGPLSASGIGKPVTVVVVAPGGDLLVGGSFRDVDGLRAGGVARWSGGAWSTLGTGLALPGPLDAAVAHDILVLANGHIVVGGDFATAGGMAAAGVALWNGTSWQALGSGLTARAGARPTVRALAQEPDGDVIVAGSFVSAGGVAADNIARWDGSAWFALPGSASLGRVSEVAVSANGHIFAVFGEAENVVARWDGSVWQTVGTASVTGFASDRRVLALLPMPNGDVLAAGAFTQMNFQTFLRIARWSSGTWSSVGGGFGSSSSYQTVHTLAMLPNGDLIAGGYLPVAGYSRIARWNGWAWSPLLGADIYCTELAVDDRGEVVFGGPSHIAGGVVSAYLGRVRTTCPAVALAAGSGCSGSGGSNVLGAAALPWIGSTFVARATGMPQNSVAVSMLGIASTSVALSSIVQQGAPGCSLLVIPDLLTAHATLTGPLLVPLPIPNVPELAGQSLHQQIAPLEFTGGMFTTLTSTNRLTLTLGAF